MRLFRRGAALAVGLHAVLTFTSPPVRAECVEVDFAVRLSGRPDDYPLGPDRCVTPTPWNQTDRVWHGFNQGGLPPGTPSGFYLEVRYTSP